MRTIAAALVMLAAVGLPAAAQAHVTLNPRAVPAGGYQVLSVRVPNEDEKASTLKVTVFLPHGFFSVLYEAQPGWSVRTSTRTLPTPVQTEDGPVSTEVSAITWTASRKGKAKIAPGQFKELHISVKVPGNAGETLTFPALQTYSNGKVVHWTGAPGTETPAPQVALTAS
ncbi:MAG TPA: YcnI family protein [Solirubrobacteraceae bacterium]|nr:YcnI family protein [Solirubrobacteraceae bacterium]